jgi:O-antigen/teichoic acid export membrane protein
MRPSAVRGAVLGSVASGLGGQFGLLISGILLARGLGPASRGLLALLLLWPIVLFQVGSLGLPVASAYFIARNPTSARAIVDALMRTTILQCGSLVGVHIAIVVLLVHDRDPSTQMAGYLTLATIPAVFLQEYSTSILQGQRRFTALSLVRLMPAGANAIAAVAVWLIFRSLLGAALFLTVANILVALITTGVAASQLQEVVGSAAVRLRDLMRFGLRAWIGAAYPVETFRLDQAVVGLLLSPASLGIYVASLAFTNLPRFIAHSVGLVAYPQIAAQDPWRRRASTWRFFFAAVTFSAVAVAALEVAVGYLVPLLFGSAFAPAIPIARILLVASLLASARRILAEGMKGAGHPGAGTAAEVASWLFLAPLMLTLTPAWGLTGVAIAVTASSGLSLMTLAAIDLFHGGRSLPEVAQEGVGR